VLIDLGIANRWWEIVIKVVATLLAISFIKASKSVGDNTDYQHLRGFNIQNAVVFTIAFWPNTPIWLNFICGAIIATSYFTMYSKFTLPDHMKGDSSK
jgi:hypothetical protein